jgi:hypothetical protein
VSPSISDHNNNLIKGILIIFATDTDNHTRLTDTHPPTPTTDSVDRLQLPQVIPSTTSSTIDITIHNHN